MFTKANFRSNHNTSIRLSFVTFVFCTYKCVCLSVLNTESINECSFVLIECYFGSFATYMYVFSRDCSDAISPHPKCLYVDCWLFVCSILGVVILFIAETHHRSRLNNMLSAVGRFSEYNLIFNRNIIQPHDQFKTWNWTRCRPSMIHSLFIIRLPMTQVLGLLLLLSEVVATFSTGISQMNFENK